MIVVLNDRQFGRNLRYLRKLHHYSRVELANLICCFPRDVRDWETGKSCDVESLYLKNICSLFQINLETLLDTDLKRTKTSPLELLAAHRADGRGQSG